MEEAVRSLSMRTRDRKACYNGQPETMLTLHLIVARIQHLSPLPLLAPLPPHSQMVPRCTKSDQIRSSQIRSAAHQYRAPPHHRHHHHHLYLQYSFVVVSPWRWRRWYWSRHHSASSHHLMMVLHERMMCLLMVLLLLMIIMTLRSL